MIDADKNRKKISFKNEEKRTFAFSAFQIN